MRFKLAVGAFAGLIGGTILIVALAGDPSSERGTAEPDSPEFRPPSSSEPAPAPAEAPQATDSAPSLPASDVLLVWTSGGLPPGFKEELLGIGAVRELSVVHGDQMDLTRVTGADGVPVEELGDGWAIPLDGLAIEPATHAPFVEVDRHRFETLATGQGLVTATSAEIRGIGAGATMEVGGETVEIAAVVDDISGAGAELIVHRDDATRLGLATERYVLIRHDGDRQAVQRAIDAALERLDASEPIRFRSPAETTWLRHGDAVIPQALIKAMFGEFAYRDSGGRSIEISPEWIDANIVSTVLPIIGEVRCHRGIVDALETALTALRDDGLAYLVEPDQVAGCFEPRRIVERLAISRHSWGIAVDLNTGDNPRGSFSTQDPRLVEAMQAVGFGWGGTWLVPDPAHYEITELSG